MHTKLIAGLTMMVLALVACTDEPSKPDGGGVSDAAKDSAPDGGGASDAAKDGMFLAYQNPGCGDAAMPVWTSGTGGKMGCSYCLCTGETAGSTCYYSKQPYAYAGACSDAGGD